MLLHFAPGEGVLIDEADRLPPHKIDENMWKNREYIEEAIFLLESSNWPEVVVYISFFFLNSFPLLSNIYKGTVCISSIHDMITSEFPFKKPCFFTSY